jgi:hypothetical protein
VVSSWLGAELPLIMHYLYVFCVDIKVFMYCGNWQKKVTTINLLSVVNGRSIASEQAHPHLIDQSSSPRMTTSAADETDVVADASLPEK